MNAMLLAPDTSPKATDQFKRLSGDVIMEEQHGKFVDPKHSFLAPKVRFTDEMQK